MWSCLYDLVGAVKIDANAAMAKARYIAEQMEFISRNPGMQVGLAAGASYFAEELEINDYPFQASIPIVSYRIESHTISRMIVVLSCVCVYVSCMYVCIFLYDHCT